MTIENFTILLVVGFFSVIQSIFGMGVLVFGTPTLLLLGYDFITTLGYVLPASFTISLLQVLTARTKKVPISGYLYLLCLPGIGIGLWLTDVISITSWTNRLVGGTLLISALVRFWPPSQKLVAFLLNRYLPFYHFFMGVTHGLTNLGGALLAILASGRSNDKEVIRYTIAHYYISFSSIQMLFLTVSMGHGDLLVKNLSTAVVAAIVYLLVGNRIFNSSNNHYYNFALSLFIAAYGIAILIKL
ncbi:MAG: hypothetical protein CMF71_06840 [Magnetovibrio sp.]|nr:hypothetical protein [Magnetovibrio sp.]|tara:strand:- start:601 stop:1332 length:732 start_codon:yes stop_codon:yes gene_type:complete